MPDKNT